MKQNVCGSLLNKSIILKIQCKKSLAHLNNMKLIFLIKSLLNGKTLVRSLMNWELKQYTLYGKVLDIGGGEDPSYFRFFQKADELQVSTIDVEKLNKKSVEVNLENQQIPFSNDSFDTVLLFNFLE